MECLLGKIGGSFSTENLCLCSKLENVVVNSKRNKLTTALEIIHRDCKTTRSQANQQNPVGVVQVQLDSCTSDEYCLLTMKNAF